MDHSCSLGENLLVALKVCTHQHHICCWLIGVIWFALFDCCVIDLVEVQRLEKRKKLAAVLNGNNVDDL